MSPQVVSGLFLLALSFSCDALAQPPSDGAIEPGQWQSTETVSELVNPLMSEKLIANRLAKPAIVTFCVKSPSLRALLVGSDKAGVCTGDFNISKGQISGSRSCTTGLGKGTRKVQGTYSATQIDTQRETTQETPQGPAHTKSRVLSVRIGPCS